MGLLTIGYSAVMLAQAGSGYARPMVPQLLEKMGHRVAVETQRPKGAHDFRISWHSAKGQPNAPSSEQMQFVERIERNNPPPRQRSSEISKDDLVVIVLDQQGTVRYWRIIVDPRLVRGEFPDDHGNLHNYTFYRTDVTLEVSVPDTIDAAEVRVLSPSWDSTGALRLSPVGAVKLPPGPLQ
ncbi:MAG: hypothetical protein LAN64_17915 [Acidobacteriia bacterium]|nr:hypothetical protein [Terriglobia bacterium]